VYSTHPPPYDRRQLLVAAVLACGRGSLISDWPAAEVLEIAPPDMPHSPAIHVTVPGSAGRTAPDLVIHRRTIDPRDVRRKDGIPVTSADLVLIHLAPHLDDIQLEQMLVAADSLKILKRSRLEDLLAVREGRPGTSRLLSLVAETPGTVRSDKELLLIPLYRAAGLPQPKLNHPIPIPGQERPLTVDLAWPDIRLAFELDTQRFHGGWESAEEDRERDQLLALVSWQSQRFHRRQLEERMEEAAARAKQIYDLRRASVNP
jgi:hypothetical protein